MRVDVDDRLGECRAVEKSMATMATEEREEGSPAGWMAGWLCVCVCVCGLADRKACEESVYVFGSVRGARGDLICC
ncbi:unnamed protein product [Haemonchus placei]|uniref:Secreted protein n=1 Tax=Haemonchus placei TaxID=6290 RepID=A0A0N4WAK4_HAEPC|nr:unnamed protein product [Haemonchus placei]